MKRASLLLAASLLAGAVGVALAAGASTARRGPAPASAPAPKLGYVPPRPLLWKVSDGDNDLYLLGAFHALKPGDYPVAASVDAAFEDAELVAFEIPPEEMSSPALGQAMLAAAMQPAGRSLQQSLDEAQWRRLDAYARKRGLSMQTFQPLEAWFVSMLISLTEMGRIGYDPAQGLDQQLIARAAREHKRTTGLETGASQIAVLDSMSAAEQKQSLSEALDDADAFKERMDQLHDLWRRGDAAALEAMLTVEFKRDYGQLYQRLNVERNRAWVPQLRRMLDDSHSDDALVVVGSMHLLGPDGVVSQLKALGYKVQRL
ncbi:MAG: TraB/GumN family protein [Arenimonas sp.]